MLASAALLSSLLLLWAALDSWNTNGLFHKMGLPGIKFDQARAAAASPPGAGQGRKRPPPPRAAPAPPWPRRCPRRRP